MLPVLYGYNRHNMHVLTNKEGWFCVVLGLVHGTTFTMCVDKQYRNNIWTYITEVNTTMYRYWDGGETTVWFMVRKLHSNFNLLSNHRIEFRQGKFHSYCRESNNDFLILFFRECLVFLLEVYDVLLTVRH